jgi:hypothetical protein
VQRGAGETFEVWSEIDGRRALSPSLLCVVGGRSCALPLTHVTENMRALPIEPFAGAPAST